jgi:hypothetical protein
MHFLRSTVPSELIEDPFVSVDGNLLPESEIFQHDRVMAFSEQPNQSK